MKDQMKRTGADQTFVSAGSADLAEDDELEEDDNKSKSKKRRKDDDEYEDEEVWEEDGVMGSRFGHKKEMVSYGEMDEEDEIVRNEKNDVDSTIMNEEDNASNEAAVVSDQEGDDEDIITYGSMKINKATDTLYLQPLRVDPSNQPLLMVSLVEQAVTKTVVQQKKVID